MHSSLARHFVESDGDRKGFAAVHVRTMRVRAIIRSRVQISSIKGADNPIKSTNNTI
jgi:hypothetical protein